MQDGSVEEKLKDLMARRLGWKSDDLLFADQPPFDITRPNIHDSKKEFLLERDTVRGIVDRIREIVQSLFKPEDESTPEHEQMVKRLSVAIDAAARQDNARFHVESAQELVRKNVADVGFYRTALFTLIDMYFAYNQRLVELNEQEAQYWNVAHRPPNYYARTIALRFARFYAEVTGRRPTFGTSRDGPHPSTDYGRILEQVFEILDIDVNIRGPAEWAMSQFTEDDLEPPKNVLAGGLLGMLSASRTPNSLASMLPPFPGREKGE